VAVRFIGPTGHRARRAALRARDSAADLAVFKGLAESLAAEPSDVEFGGPYGRRSPGPQRPAPSGFPGAVRERSARRMKALSGERYSPDEFTQCSR
jgi:hypothetical protein